MKTVLAGALLFALLLPACGPNRQSTGDAGNAGATDAGVADSGGSDSGPPLGDGGLNQVIGSVMGQTLVAADALNASGGESVEVLIANSSGLCAAATNNITPPSATVLVITVVRTESDGGALFATPGSYTVFDSPMPPPDTNLAQVTFHVDDATCNINQSESAAATSGTVTLTASSVGGVAQGTFDVMFGTDHVTGTFDAPACQTVGQGANTCP